jgi:membrane protein involved in D-alanine export
MSNLPIFIFSLLGYVFFAQFALSLSNRKLRQSLFCAANLAGIIWVSLLTRYDEWNAAPILSLGYEVIVRHILLIGGYILVVAAGFLITRKFAKRESWLPWLAFFYPIAVLVVFKYFYFFWNPLFNYLDWDEWVIAATVIGLSYMAFRLSYLVLEVRNGVVEMPNLPEYLGFAFFLPTILIGPISPYSMHQRSIESFDKESIPTGRCLLRIIIGATKFLFLANLANQLSYAGIFLDGKPHSFFDLGVAMVFYYLYLYLNFSGFCDLAIGVAGLMGVQVKENFDNPFAAKNIKEFWNRWHITLSEYMRDVIFAPLSKTLIKKLGARYTNFSIAVAIFAVFLTIGIWHGVGWHYAVFGLIHAVGVASNHYYTIWMKRALGREKYKLYNENPLINAAATVLTFGYVAASLAFFANGRDMLGIIKSSLLAGLQI